MKYETDNFIIYYSEVDERYIEDIINILNNRVQRVLEFFKISINDKIIIKLYSDLEEYKNNINNSFKSNFEKGIDNTLRTYKDWMIANTEDGNINMQSLDLVKSNINYRRYSQEEYCYNVIHEFVHICQQKIGSTSPGWFWEVVATTLGNPECHQETKETFTLDDLNNRFDLIDGYGAVYKVGKYLFENYDDNFILELVKDNEKLNSVMPDIINKVNNKLVK